MVARQQFRKHVFVANNKQEAATELMNVTISLRSVQCQKKVSDELFPKTS
jgi:hypothetical protein